jgi:hypothetical protein
MRRHSFRTPQQRGKRAEERFFKAWNNSINFAAWMVSVSRPTKHEDLFEKTDAVIVRIDGPNLKIQIKSYRLHPDECTVFMEYGVIPLSISQGDSLTKIRKKTLLAVHLFKKFVPGKTHLKRSLSLSNVKTMWYKRRRKRHVL